MGLRVFWVRLSAKYLDTLLTPHLPIPPPVTERFFPQNRPSMTEEVIHQQYDQMAQRYDRRWSTYICKTLSFLAAWAAISPRALVLGIGCGTGEVEKLFLATHPNQQIVAAHISQKLLEIAQQNRQAYSTA